MIETFQSKLKQSAQRTAITGVAAGLLSMATLARRGRIDTGSSVAAINAPSHWLHGDRALRANAVSVRYTLAGMVIHQLSALMWGLVYDQLFCRGRTSVSTLIAGAAGVTALAAAVDLKAAPARLTPGFERRLSRKSLFWTYGAFAVGLAVGGLLVRERE